MHGDIQNEFIMHVWPTICPSVREK